MHNIISNIKSSVTKSKRNSNKTLAFITEISKLENKSQI